jgi:hypothetical protein
MGFPSKSAASPLAFGASSRSFSLVFLYLVLIAFSVTHAPYSVQIYRHSSIIKLNTILTSLYFHFACVWRPWFSASKKGFVRFRREMHIKGDIMRW